MGRTQKPLPSVCVVDENQRVELGWRKSLGKQAVLYFYRDHFELFAHAKKDETLYKKFDCIIMGRLFPHITFDLIKSNVPETISAQSPAPIFLNWQGYVPKEELDKKFDGKIFHRYGIKWHTLRLRIQRLQRKNDQILPAMIQKTSFKEARKLSKLQKCQNLLRVMAEKAQGPHKDKIRFYATHDQITGIQLLEVLYNELITNKNRPMTCPSRYINSSPVIAAKILQETLRS